MDKHPRLAWFLALGISVCLLAFVAYDQSYWWVNDPSYAFGFLVPVFCFYISHERWPLVSRLLDLAQAPGAPRVKGLRGLILAAGAFGFLAFGGAGLVLGSLIRADNPLAITSSTFLITLGSLLIVFGLLYLCIPLSQTATEPKQFGRDSRLRVLGPLVLPCAIWMISARMPGVFEERLSLFLQDKVVGFVAFVFDVSNATLIREGNVLLLPTGRVGVAEACSGIRSLMGCLFSGLLLGAFYFHTWTPKILLLLGSVLLAFLMNLARSLLLTFLAYRHGASSIDGLVHTLTGYGVLVLTVLGLLLMVGFMKGLGRLEFGLSRKRDPV